jgi:uncharacterized membrane protein
VPAPERIYAGLVRAMSVLMIVLGLAIEVRALSSGAGVLSVGVLLGIAFLAVGGFRLYLGRDLG